MVDDSWGHKHYCTMCRTRFYDLGRNPVVCPRCNGRIDSADSGTARRSPVASGLATVSVLGAVDPSDIEVAPVPVDLAADEDVLESVAIDDNSRGIRDSDREDVDGGDDDSDEFGLDDEKVGDLDDDEDSPVEEDDDDPEAVSAPGSVDDDDETEDDEELEEDEDVEPVLVGDDPNDFESDGDIDLDQDDGDSDEPGLNPEA